jgi:hypothetical protein
MRACDPGANQLPKLWLWVGQTSGFADGYTPAVRIWGAAIRLITEIGLRGTFRSNATKHGGRDCLSMSFTDKVSSCKAAHLDDSQIFEQA